MGSVRQPGLTGRAAGRPDVHQGGPAVQHARGRARARVRGRSWRSCRTTCRPSTDAAAVSIVEKSLGTPVLAAFDECDLRAQAIPLSLAVV